MKKKTITRLRRYHAAAGFAIDRLEGDGIKKERVYTPTGEALAVLARLQQKK